MARPKPAIALVPISLRVSPQFLELVDLARGKHSRGVWIEAAVAIAITSEHAAPSNPLR